MAEALFIGGAIPLGAPPIMRSELPPLLACLGGASRGLSAAWTLSSPGGGQACSSISKPRSRTVCHRHYWVAGAQLYEQIALLAGLLRPIKKRLRARVQRIQPLRRK